MKQRPRPILPPIDATGELVSHSRSQHHMETKGFAWKHLPTGTIVQKHIALSPEMLRIQAGLQEGQSLRTYIPVPVKRVYREWVEVEEDEPAQGE